MIRLPRHDYSPNSEASVSNDGKIPGFRKFLFLSSVIKFDNKWANSKQRSQSPTIVSAKSKIYSPRRGYLSPGNSIILEIAATLLFFGVTVFCWFWGSFCWNSSTLPTDLFIFVSPSCLQSNTKNILPYHISTLSSKIQYTAWYYNSQRQKISQNPFPAKHFIETNNILAIRGKNLFLFHCVHSIVSNYHVLQVQTLSWRTFSLNTNDAQNSRQALFQIILDCHISNFFFYLTLLNPDNFPFGFSVVHNTTLVVKYWKYSSLWFRLDGRKIVVEVHYSSLLRFQIIIACLVHPIDVPFLSSMRAYFFERCTKTPSALQWLSTPLLVNENNKLTRQNVYLYLIKLAQQKDANLILTRKCFTIAIKTIHLSSHIIKHDEFIKATFSSEQYFETNNKFAIRGKNPFLFHYMREEKKLNRVKYAQYYNKLKFQNQTVSTKNLSLNNEAQNRRQAFFQIILGCHISNYFFLPEDCAELITDPLKVFDSFSVFVEPISYQRISHLVSVFYITAHLVKQQK